MTIGNVAAGVGTALPRFLPAGDTALVAQFGEGIDRAVNRRVMRLARAVRAARLEGVVDVVPTFRSLLLHYDPLRTGQAALTAALTALLDADAGPPAPGRRWRIPVCYQGDCAPDLDAVARTIGLSPAELVAQHSATLFEVFMMGFLPGFPYLGILPEAFDLPRRPEPRLRLPARSVSVAQRQTTIYTMDSPGGWHLIGRTPVEFYDPGRTEPILVAAGDQIRFEPVDRAAYATLRRAVRAGEYHPRPEPVAADG